MRFDLQFLLCCCNAFLASNEDDSFYQVLGVDPDATPEEIKKAYKRQSLELHPDKLAQRGLEVTDEARSRFQHMKEAYECLSDPHKRQTYDAVGKKGMKILEEPLSMDPQELASNFAKSSVVDRAKIFSIFVAIAIGVLLLPCMLALKADGVLGDASWMATLTPLWLWNAFLLFYHIRVIQMGQIPRPDHIPPEEWVDPLPMPKRYMSLARFLVVVLFELLLVFKLDGVINPSWVFIFFPLYIWEAHNLYRKVPLARIRIVTVEDLEHALAKPFSEFTPAEKELISQRYSVVSSIDSPDFERAQQLKTRSRHSVIKSAFRIGFVVMLLFQLESNMDLSWWLVFLPYWVMICILMYANYQAYTSVKLDALAKDPTIFGPPPPDVELGESSYGAVGTDGNATAQSNLSEQEKAELRAQVAASSSRLGSKCCSQGVALFVVVLLVSKLQGAGFSSFWILSPFLFIAGIILCCLGCAIFGVSEVPADGFDFAEADGLYATGGVKPTYMPPMQTPEATEPTVTMPPPEPTPAPMAPSPALEKPAVVVHEGEIDELD